MDEIIKERIRQTREDEGYSQSEFAKKLGLSKQTISNYETGARQPGLDIIMNIAEIFSVRTDYLLGKSQFKNYEEERKYKNVQNTYMEPFKYVLNSIEYNISSLINTLYSKKNLGFMIKLDEIFEELLKLNEYENITDSMYISNPFEAIQLKDPLIHICLSNMYEIISGLAKQDSQDRNEYATNNDLPSKYLDFIKYVNELEV